jgi:hypothetical protein
MEIPKERDHSEDRGADGRIILRLIPGKLCEKVGTKFIFTFVFHKKL